MLGSASTYLLLLIRFALPSAALRPFPHRAETGAFIGHRRSLGIVLPWMAVGLPRTESSDAAPAPSQICHVCR